jgi:predicted lipid-binding transport protein (Tim44 family)
MLRAKVFFSAFKMVNGDGFNFWFTQKGKGRRMNKKVKISILVGFKIIAFLLYFWQDAAEAARLGGGKSFGSKPSYQRSAPSTPPSPTSPQVSPGQPTQQRPVAGPTPSPMGRWGGMLGGLLMGGLIGSLLFGGGHTYGGPGLFDILLIGGGLFLLYRFIRARRMATATAAPSGSMSFDRSPFQGWGGRQSGFSPSVELEPPAVAPPTLPAGFDADAFLKGAKAIYTRLQASWDKRDLEDIRQFVSAEVLDEIELQTQADPRPGKTELLLINPSILEAREVEEQTIVSVLYDVMMRENGTELTKQVRELWHFSRETKKPEDFWKLEGIQQIEQ